MIEDREPRLRPWLWLPSQQAHDWAPLFLPLLLPFYSVKDSHWRGKTWKGLSFKNPLGLAGGVDKTGKTIKPWSQLGAGFVEVGTVTPEPQGPNPGKIMARDIPNQSLWNKMGFPNPGVKALQQQLQKLGPLGGPLFVNIGKNRWTENSQAHADYAACAVALKNHADVFVVNVSSPNTKGLRDLLNREDLIGFLEQLRASLSRESIQQPLLLKLSPDMKEENLKDVLVASADFVDGWILTNTTKTRYESSPFPSEEGGVSGRPLKELSLNALRVAVNIRASNQELSDSLYLWVESQVRRILLRD